MKRFAIHLLSYAEFVWDTCFNQVKYNSRNEQIFAEFVCAQSWFICEMIFKFNFVTPSLTLISTFCLFRRMFPVPDFCLAGLEPNQYYGCAIEIIAVDSHRYRHKSSQGWVCAGKGMPLNELHTKYLHPNSASLGQYWMREGAVFDKLKLSNHILPSGGNVSDQWYPITCSRPLLVVFMEFYWKQIKRNLVQKSRKSNAILQVRRAWKSSMMLLPNFCGNLNYICHITLCSA